jgi:hypothetical protein
MNTHPKSRSIRGSGGNLVDRIRIYSDQIVRKVHAGAGYEWPRVTSTHNCLQRSELPLPASTLGTEDVNDTL